MGEAKTPDALRNASDQFFEWVPPELQAESAEKGDTKPSATKLEQSKPEPPKPPVKRRPRFVVEAVSLLAGDTSEGKVGLGALGQYLKRTDPAFTPQTFGHSGLLDMVRTYDLLVVNDEGGGWSVSLAPQTEPVDGNGGVDAAAN